MGLSIIVPCNCYRDELCSEPPIDRNLILFDQENYNYGLKLKYKGNEDIFLKFDIWKGNCCKHEDMDYFYSYIGSNIMVARIIDFIDILGKEFNLTSKMLKNTNGGNIKISFSKKVLEELNEIKTDKDVENIVKKNNLYKYSQYCSEFYDIIDTLKKACLASIEIGNPLFIL